MADNANILDIQVDTRQLQQQSKDAAAALTELDTALSGLNQSIRDAFSVKGYQDYLQTVQRFGKSLANELLTLQLRFGQLKVAVAQALAPVASVFVPMLNDAMLALIRFSGMVGQFMQGLLGTTQGSRDMSKAVDTATKSQNKLTTATRKTGKALRRTLAGFDQLERLNPTASAASGGSAATPAATVPVEVTPYVPEAVSEQVQAVIDKILQFLAPLREIDLTNLRTALQTLGQAFRGLGELAGSALKYLWEQVLVPFTKWVLEKLAPALTECFAAKLTAITAALAPVMAGLQQLWEALQPVVNFIGQTVLQVLDNWKNTYLGLAQVLSEKSGVITGIFSNLAQMATAMWNKVSPILTAMGSAFQTAFDGILTHVKATVGYLLEALGGLTGFLAGAFTGNWKSAWNGIKSFLKNTINGIIGLMNTMIARLVAALNAVISAANKISFTLPSWIPELGGRTFGLNLKTVSAPKIPYLAQGAVLPANKPFLAMVGDQHHGTNIEAPLATIQEAVAAVMGDQVSAMMAGFNALLEENQRLRQVVESIELGDTVIGQAADRYSRKMAIVRGV